MASKSLGTLTLDLVAKIGGFTAGLDKAARESEKRIKQIKDAASTIGKAVGVAFAGAVTGLAALTKEAIDNADELGKLSQKVGIAADDLSKLQYAAKLADVDTAALQTSLVKLSKSAVDASDGTGDAAAAFKALGVDVKDSNGQIKSSYDLLLETAEAFSKYEDSAEKTAAAVAIFGKAGADMIPLLNGGAVAIREAGDELERLGGVVTPEAAKQAEAFNDNLTRLKQSASGLGTELATSLLPTLVSLTDRFVEFNKEARDSEKLADGLEVALRGLTGVGTFVANVFQVAGDNIAAWAAIVGAVLSGDFKGAVDIAKQRLEDLKTDLDDVRHGFDGAGKSAADAGAAIADSIRNFKPDVSGAPNLADMFGGGSRGRLGYSDQKNAETKATNELTEAERQFNNEIEARISILDELKAMAEEVKETESRQTDIGLDAAEEIQAEAERIDEVLTDLQNKQIEFADTFRGAFEAYADSVKNVSSLLGGDFVTALDSAIARTADLAANTILWGEGGTEAIKELARSIITDFVSSLIRAGVQMAVNFALQRTLSAASTAAGVSEAAALATAWSPAAIAASIATLGSADAVGLAAYTAAQASGQALTQLGGFAEGGFTGHGSLDEVAGVVHKGEYVLSNDMLRRLDDMDWGGGNQIQIINNAPGIKITPRGNTLTVDMIPELLELVDSDQAARSSSGLGRNFQKLTTKFGAQQRSDR